MSNSLIAQIRNPVPREVKELVWDPSMVELRFEPASHGSLLNV